MITKIIYRIRKILAFIIRVPESVLLILELTIDPDISMQEVNRVFNDTLHAMIS